jgi:hypothetical protein
VLTTPTVTVNSGNICAGSVFTVSPSGASSYTISGGSFVVTPATSATYAVSGTGINGCPSANTAISSVTVNAVPVLSITGPSAVCLGSPASYSVTGAANYLWSTSSAASVITVSPFTASTYSVKGLVAAGCSGTAAVNVGVMPLPTVAVNSGTSCPGTSFVISPTGAVTYTISGGSFSVSPQVTTGYQVLGTGTNGCVSAFPAISTVSVINTASMLVTAPPAICLGDTAVLAASGAGTIHWSAGSGGNVVTVTPSVSSTYTVTNTNGGCSDTIVALVQVNPLPVILASASPSLICQAESALLASSGANTYLWSMGGNSSSVTVTPLSTAIYTVTGKDINGCVSSATVSLTVNSCVGLDSYAAPVAVKLYPNPNTGEFVIESPATGRALISNALGESVLALQLEAGRNTVGLGNLAKGLYWVHIVLPGSVQTIRIVRQ